MTEKNTGEPDIGNQNTSRPEVGREQGVNGSCVLKSEGIETGWDPWTRMTKQEQYSEMLELGNVTVSGSVSWYWGAIWLEWEKGQDWQNRYKDPKRYARRIFNRVWDGDFAPRLLKAPLVPSEEAEKLCPERFRERYFDHSQAHAIVEVRDSKYLIQMNAYIAHVVRMWRLPS